MSKWIPAWRSVPIDYNYEVATFENITQNCLMINNLRGEQMRIRFNNLYSNSPIAIDYVTVSLSNRVTGRRSTRQTVTLDGEETIWLCANSQPYSDPVPMEITPEDDILVSMYFRRKTAFRYLRRSQLAEYAPHREFSRNGRTGLHVQIPACTHAGFRPLP